MTDRRIAQDDRCGIQARRFLACRLRNDRWSPCRWIGDRMLLRPHRPSLPAWNRPTCID